MDTRLKSKIWVDAHIRTCFLNDMPAFVVARGDEARGGILLKINRFAKGVLVYEQSLDFDGNRLWRALSPGMGDGGADGMGEPEADADARIAKKRRFDSDLWVIEIEDRLAQYRPDAPVSLL